MEQQSGGCCIARYAAAGDAYDMSKVDRIMLRYRPIAPKPASTDGSVPGGGSSGSAVPEKGGACVKAGRRKRRYAARDGCSSGAVGRRGNSRRRKCSPENTDSGGSVTGGERDVKTLPLMPEEPDVRGSAKEEAAATSSRGSYPMWLSFGNEGGAGGGIWIPATDRSEVVALSWVKVERVTDTWSAAAPGGGGYDHGGGMGSTDEERMMSLQVDTCPGFVTDGANRVRWTNAAYRRMTAEGEAAAASVAVEWAVEVPSGCEGFTCRVRVVTCGKEKRDKTVPCDVWRMECGGFAWRLDTAAALSLWVGH